MKVDFDGLRKNLARVYGNTVEGYREAIENIGYDNSFALLKDGLDDMRSMICALLCCYDEEKIKSENDFHELGEVADNLPHADPKDDNVDDWKDE